MTQSRVTDLHAKPLVITQPASQAGRVQKEDTGERERWEGGKEKHKSREEKLFRFLPRRGRRVLRGALDTKLEHESCAECQIAECVCVSLCLLCEPGTNEMWRGVLFAQQVGSCSVQVSTTQRKQSHAKHVDTRKTLPGRRAAGRLDGGSSFHVLNLRLRTQKVLFSVMVKMG